MRASPRRTVSPIRLARRVGGLNEGYPAAAAQSSAEPADRMIVDDPGSGPHRGGLDRTMWGMRTAPSPDTLPAQRGVAQSRTRPAYRRLHVAAGLTFVAALGAALLVPQGASAHPVTGTVLLWQDGAGTAVGAPCTGRGDDADVTVDAPVRVKDANGRLLATGRLLPGRYDGTACAFTFLVPEVTKSGGYRISVGDPARPSTPVTYRQMRAQSWSVRVTLGS
jgi:hypothetical protein